VPIGGAARSAGCFVALGCGQCTNMIDAPKRPGGADTIVDKDRFALYDWPMSEQVAG
jgi:hypothetical protein